tara:strand:- start:3936 stop:4439 length:504 start_codon:yes stop_codon:yes gene_type:complete
MTSLLNNEYISILLTNNIINITVKNEMPNEENINIIKNTMDTFYNLCQKKNIKFFHLFNFKNISLLTLPQFAANKYLVSDFFIKHYKLFQTNLYCSALVIDNFIVRNCIKLVLNIYTPNKPIAFFSTKEECPEFFNKIENEYKTGKWTFEKEDRNKFKDYKNICYNE